MKRWDVLSRLLRHRPHAIGAEIGVQAGRTTRHLLRSLPGLRTLYCVDPWQLYPDYELDRVHPADEWPSQRMLDQDRARFMAVETEFPGRIVVVSMTSERAAAVVPDDALDFAFIDANHLYDYIRRDLQIWSAKVKPGGVVAGHDYAFPVDAWGVQRAVDEAFGDRVHVEPDYVWWVEV